MPCGIYKRGKPHCYTPWQLVFLRRRQKLPRRQLWELFTGKYGAGVSFEALKATCKRMGFSTGRTGCFEKGYDSTWTEAQRRNWKPNAGNFQKGQMPRNHVPVGSESLTLKYKTKRIRYMRVKITEPNKWQWKHILVWEKYRGKVPKEMCLIFKDGNQQNCKLGNLQLVTRLLHLLLNQHGYAHAPKKMKKSIMLMARLEEQVSKKGVHQYRLRKCRHVPHKCTKCGETIYIGRYYYDAGNRIIVCTRHRRKP